MTEREKEGPTTPQSSRAEARFIPTALVVDDEPVLLRALERLLRGAFRVVSAATPEDALTAVGNNWPDLILSDFNLPRMTGVHLVRALRQSGLQVPAIIMTAGIDQDEIQDALKAGLIQKVLKKPWNATSLVPMALSLLDDRSSGLT